MKAEKADRKDAQEDQRVGNIQHRSGRDRAGTHHASALTLKQEGKDKLAAYGMNLNFWVFVGEGSVAVQ